MKSQDSSRRSFIKGISLGSGGVLLAPLLRQLSAEAAGAQAMFPQRFVFLVKSLPRIPSGLGHEANVVC